MPEWSAEQVVDEALARHLLETQFPELAPEPLRLLGEGWDSTVWRLGDGWVLRFPRREMVIPGLAREMAALEVLAPALPLRIPVAELRGAPGGGFPWPWAGSRYIPGREIGEAAPDDDRRAAHGAEFARFVRALHDVHPGSVRVGGEALPVDVVHRADMPFRVAKLRERLETLDRRGLWRAPAGLAPLLDEAVALPPRDPAALRVCHGDLHLRHLLLGDDGSLTGVIDWIDVCRGDPAIDLPLYWGYLPPAGREAFHEVYGPLDRAALVRSRVLAVFLWGTMVEYGHDVGPQWLMDEAVAGLDRAVDDLR
jgi:aminoglycoside phosphotransferase (APT) family kinase protein